MQNVDQYWSACYDTGRDFQASTTIELNELLLHVNPSPATPKTCLDIGCGTGQLTRELWHRGWRCVGIDGSGRAVELAQAATTVSPKELTYIKLDIASDSTARLPSTPYALITCKFVYAFLRDKHACLQKIAKLLANDGAFVVITPLTTDVPAEKAAIAVELEPTLAELKAEFSHVRHYAHNGVSYFICKK